MVLSHHGRHTGVREVSEQCGVGRDGLSALAIVKAARDHGLTATAYKAEAIADAPSRPWRTGGTTTSSSSNGRPPGTSTWSTRRWAAAG